MLARSVARPPSTQKKPPWDSPATSRIRCRCWRCSPTVVVSVPRVFEEGVQIPPSRIRRQRRQGRIFGDRRRNAVDWSSLIAADCCYCAPSARCSTGWSARKLRAHQQTAAPPPLRRAAARSVTFYRGAGLTIYEGWPGAGPVGRRHQPVSRSKDRNQWKRCPATVSLTADDGAAAGAR